MKDIMSFVQGSQETQDQFDKRRNDAAKLNLKKISKRLANESAEDHYDRFVLYQNSVNGFFTLHSLYRNDFLNEKRKIYTKFENEVVNSMEERPGESLNKYLSRVDSIMINYSDLINDRRDDISETLESRASRISKFHDIRGKIKLDLALKPEKEKLNNLALIEEVKESAREKIRQNTLNESMKAEQERKRKKKEQFEKKNTIQIFLFLFLVIVIFSVGAFLTSLV